jgi:hypothetical protein
MREATLHLTDAQIDEAARYNALLDTIRGVKDDARADFRAEARALRRGLVRGTLSRLAKAGILGWKGDSFPKVGEPGGPTLSEVIAALRAAGGDAWDHIPDVEVYLEGRGAGDGPDDGGSAREARRSLPGHPGGFVGDAGSGVTP